MAKAERAGLIHRLTRGRFRRPTQETPQARVEPQPSVTSSLTAAQLAEAANSPLARALEAYDRTVATIAEATGGTPDAIHADLRRGKLGPVTKVVAASMDIAASEDPQIT